MSTRPLRPLAALLVLLVPLAACDPASPPRDAAPDRADLDAAPADAPPDDANDATADTAPPPAPGSTEALLAEACAGRARAGEAATLAWATLPSRGVIPNLAAGDSEALRLAITEPFRVRALRVYLVGREAGGQVRVRLTADRWRSVPDTDTDLAPPATVDFARSGWVEVPLDPPVDLHPARHAWVVVEHVTALPSVGVGAAVTPGVPGVSRLQSAMVSAPDPWVGIGGAGFTSEYLIEARGERICPRAAPPYFSEVTAGSGVSGMAGHAQWADIDGDGWDDLFGFTGEGETSRVVIHRNRHDGTFEPYTARAGLADAPATGGLFVDLDDDGDRDAVLADYVGGTDAGPLTDPARGSHVWIQGSDGRFARQDVLLEPRGPTRATALADCDHDGVLDLAVGQWYRIYGGRTAPDWFLRGLGAGRFEDATAAAGLPAPRNGPTLWDTDRRPTFSMEWADYDNDGDADLFVGNYGWSPNDLWRNRGDCTFENAATQTGFAGTTPQHGNAFGLDIADYDNDGDLDVFEAAIAHARDEPAGLDHSRLLRNAGAPGYGFEDVREAAGVLTDEGDHEGVWADYDNDGDLDLFVSVGPAYGYQPSRLYRQEADHRFTDVTYLAGIRPESGGGASFNDVDRDGDLDLVTALNTRTMYRNELRNGNHWLEVRLEGRAGGRNRDAIGGRVYVSAQVGGADGATVRQMREVVTARGFTTGQWSRYQHFGLGRSAGPVELEVRWPGATTTTRYAGVMPDRRYTIVQGEDAPRAE